MSALLDRLFKPKWQHRDAATRLRAIETLADEQVLMSLAQQDPEQAVREQALKKIKHPDRLYSLCQMPSLRTLAASQLTRVLLADKSIAALSDTEKLNIAAVTEDDILREQVLCQVRDETLLLPFILQTNSAKARNLAASMINTANALQELANHFKGKDKNLYRQCKDKLEALAQTAEKQRQLEEQQQKLLNQARQLAKAAFSPTYQGELLLLKQSWAKQAVSADMQQAFVTAISQCDALLDSHQQELARLASENKAREDATTEQQRIIESMQTELENIRTCAEADATTLHNFLQDKQQAWAATLQHGHDKNLQASFTGNFNKLQQIANSLQAFNEHNVTLQNLLSQGTQTDKLSLDKQHKLLTDVETFIHSLNWPSLLTAPAALQQLQALAQSLNAHLRTLKAAEKDKSKSLSKHLSALEQLLNEGHLKDARKTLNEAFNLLRELPAEQNHKYQHELQHLQARVQELADWQEFAAEPKLIALCEQMENLANSELNVETRAERIQQLQNEWKNFASATPALSQPLWPRFKQASDLAYAPCKIHFENLAQLRQQNKEARLKICAELETYASQYTWENADWQAVQKVLEVAHQEWQRFSPVDRKDNKTLQDSYQLVTQQIRERLQNHQQTCAAQKMDLINQARALLELDDITNAIETNKALQESWKTLGYAGKKDHSLWKQFRSACDALFDRRQQARQSERQFVEQQIKQAEHLLQQANLFLTHEQQTLDFTELEIAFMQLSLPEKVQHALSSKLKQIKKQLDQMAQVQANQASQNRLRTAWQLHQEISDMELAGAAAQVPQDSDLDDDIRHAFNSRLQNTRDAATCHQLCLEIEILTGKTSPAADNEARMALQLSLLQSRIGQGKQENEQHNLLLRWLSLPAAGENYQNLNQRVAQALLG